MSNSDKQGKPKWMTSNSDKQGKPKWITLIYDGEEYRIVRADSSNQKYTNIARKRLNPYHRKMANKTLDPQIYLRVLAGIFADSVIIEWKNVKDSQCQDMPFTRDNVIKNMMARPNRFLDIQEQSRILENFSEEVVTTE